MMVTVRATTILTPTGAVEWCNTLRERWGENGPRSRLRIRLLTPEEMEKNKPRRKRRRRE